MSIRVHPWLFLRARQRASQQEQPTTTLTALAATVAPGERRASLQPYPLNLTPFPSGCRRTSRRGLTLVEVLMALAVTSLLTAGVLSAFLAFGRSGIRLGHYADMEFQSRRALEQFGVDARMARTVVWNSASHVTLLVPLDAAGGTYTVDYRFHGPTSLPVPLRSTFTRTVTASGNPALVPLSPDTDGDGAPNPQVLARDLTRFQFLRYKRSSPASAAGAQPAGNGSETRQLAIELAAARTGTLVASTTAASLSARFILRNKVVTP